MTPSFAPGPTPTLLLPFTMPVPWTPYCKNKSSYDHAEHHGGDVSCPYCGMDNPEYRGKQSTPAVNPNPTNPPIIVLGSSPPAQQTAATRNNILLSSLDRESETARQQSIARTQQKKSDRPNAGSIALSARPKLPKPGTLQSQLITPSYVVHVYVWRAATVDLDLELCENYESIS
jgi:hypothetical protein